MNVGIASATAGEAWKVCLDGNQNLACDADEPSATATANGSYQLTLPAGMSMTGRYWVAELPGASSGSVALRLAAPVSTPMISSLSTLVVAQMLSTPDDGVEVAQQKVLRVLGLPSDTDLSTAPGASGDGQIGLMASNVMTALQAGTQARTLRLQDATQPMAGEDDASQPLSIAQVVLSVMNRYSDATSGALLPTVGVRTIAFETAAALNPTQCSIAEPLRIRIDTDQSTPIESRDDYVKARLRTDASALYGEALDLQTSIRGRGNSTWYMPKKPYKLKLSTATALLGMAADKEWALLANYSDKSLLRNAVAFCLSRTLGLSYTPAYRYVELELNGQYQGVYQLTEQIKATAQRVDIGSAAASGDDPGGFLLEVDDRLDADSWFVSKRAWMPYTFKSDTNATQLQQVQQLIQQFEDTLFGSDFMTRGAGGYLPLLDTEAMVDFYLINELMRNNDAFFSSTFVTRKDNGPLVFGPVWDFDIAAGNINYNGNDSPTGWWVRQVGSSIYNGYILQLFNDPSFERHVAARWAFLSRRMPALQRFIHQSAATLDAAQKRNFQTWDILNTWVWPNAQVPGSYAGEIDYLSNWLQQRSAWMNQTLQTPGTTALPRR